MGTFAENLRYYREKAELSQKELAKAIGVSVAAYNKYETRGNEPKIDILIKLANALNVDVNTLVGFRQTAEEILIDHEGRCPEYFNRLQILYMGYFTKDDAWKITINGEEGSGSFPVPTAELESMVTTCHKRATSETSKIFQALKKTESELFFNLLEMELIRYASKKFKPGSMTTEPQTDSAETTDNK